MSIDEIDEIDEVEAWLAGRELLGRAVDGVSAPAGGGAGGTEAVFARAARVRRRRWGGVTVVAAVTATVGAVAGPGWLTYDEAGPNVGTAQPVGEATQEAARIAKLLPAGVGEIRGTNLRPGDIFWKLRYAQAGPSRLYHRDFTVNRDGGVGYLRVDGVFSEYQATGFKKPCVWRPEAAKEWSTGDRFMPYNVEKSCTFERLPNGDVLELRESLDQVNLLVDATSVQKWGKYLSATLYLKSGGYLQVDDTVGFTGKESLGKPLASLPLTKDQLRELALDPKLLPKIKN